MRVSLNREGIIDVEWGRTLRHLHFDVGLSLSYARNPVTVFSSSSGDRLGSLVQDRLGGALFGTLGLFDWVELGLEVPLVLYQGRPANQPGIAAEAVAALSAVGFGDLRLLPKVRLLQSDKHAIDLAVLLGFTLPTGFADEFRGDKTPTFSPELAVSRAFRGPRLAANVGVTLRGATQYLSLIAEHELNFRMGAGYRFKDIGKLPFEIDVSLAGAMSLLSPLQRFNQTALELRGQLSYEFSNLWQVFLGGGAGLSRGYGTPAFRVFAGVRFGHVKPAEPPASAPASAPAPAPAAKPAPPPPPKDSDGDGLIDADDRCPNDAEDRDGFEDGDGCPDRDNDQDGVADAQDKCPLTKGPAENKGCPDQDRDGDGVVDRLDNCPNEAGSADNAGCKRAQLVVVKGDRIDLKDAVYFDVGKDTIQKKSFNLLDNVAAVLLDHPEIQALQIDGHTDNKGNAAKNRALSSKRAEAVKRYLEGRGVDASRMNARGFGDSRPIAPNTTEKGRAKNRRVEFLIAQ